MLEWIWKSLVIGCEIGAIVAALLLLRRPREPRAMLAWIMALVFLPVVGLFLFIFFGEPRRRWHRIRRRRSRKRIEAATTSKAGFLVSPQAVSDLTPIADPSSLLHLTRNLEVFNPTDGNEVTIFNDAELTFRELQLAIGAASSHIHLEYYIFQADETGGVIRDLLIAKAMAGVRCRVLLDYVGCLRLSRKFLRPMREAGVHVAFSLPIVPWRGRWRVNYRNHRKVAVVDGAIGFTGSQNIGDEYRGRLKKFGPWRDTHLKIVGPSVHHLQEVFAQDWYYTTHENLFSDRYFPTSRAHGDHVVQIVPSGPDQSANVMHQLLFAAVSAARSSIFVITPYFVPDEAMVLALQSAAYRGVQVQILIPTCSDHRTVLWAGRSYYEDLINAGVHVYEHDHTMLHSKSMVIDRAWAMVGSANMDERSFLINFELTTLLYSRKLAEVLHHDFEALRSRSRRIRKKNLRARSVGESMLLGIARLASPLL